jgi:RNA recognition motif-containing protein
MSNENKIFVGNMPFRATKDDLQSVFSRYGQIENIILINDKATGRPKGFGFITFVDATAAKAALAMDNQDFQGRNLKVNIAKEQQREERF